ncbi:hypothetical protein NUW58_g1927 [Xylaria curta]|uniref:Uncharacterized protein n=1 Tax=Xylaria curta TaxID=42375 RepID=A0ACC1PLA5_9PEZI|nr:hypothetical protein NUW58_g1927 [Xylaria curta]
MSPQQLQWPPPYPPNTQGAAVSPDPDLGYPPYIETSPDRPEPLYYGSTAGDAAPLFYTPIQDASHAALLNLAYEMQLTGQALAPNQFLLPTAGYEYYGWAQGAAGSFVSTDNTTHNTEYRDIHQGGGFGLAAYNTVGPSRHMLGQHSPTHQGLDLGFDLAPESGNFASNDFCDYI